MVKPNTQFVARTGYEQHKCWDGLAHRLEQHVGSADASLEVEQCGSTWELWYDFHGQNIWYQMEYGNARILRSFHKEQSFFITNWHFHLCNQQSANEFMTFLSWNQQQDNEDVSVFSLENRESASCDDDCCDRWQIEKSAATRPWRCKWSFGKNREPWRC